MSFFTRCRNFRCRPKKTTPVPFTPGSRRTMALERASNDADVSIVPPKIRTAGFPRYGSRLAYQTERARAAGW